MSYLPAPLTQIGPGHPAARRYRMARRNTLSRDDLVVAVAGSWAHREVLRLGAGIEVCLWCPGDARDAAPSDGGPLDDQVLELVERAVTAARSAYQVSARTLARLHPGARAPALMSVVPLPHWDVDQVLGGSSRVLLVADGGVEYAGNLGALVRTVDASGAGGLVLTRPVARLSHPLVFTASRGTVLTTPTLQYAAMEQGRRALERAGFGFVVADPDALRLS